jgi:hypothetical protein
MLLTYTPADFHDDPAQVASGTDVQTKFDEVATVVNGNIDTDNLADGAVSTAKIEASAITAALILDGAVGSDELAAGAVIAAKLGAGACTSTVLGSQAVTEAKMEYTVASSGLKVLRTGPTTTNYGTEGLAIIRCQTAVAASLTGINHITVTFAGGGTPVTTLLDGAHTFSAAPHCVGVAYVIASAATAEAPDKIWVSAVTATTATVELDFTADTTTVAGSIYTTWIGPVTV